MATEMSPSFISLGGLRLVFLYDYECAPAHIHVIYCGLFKFSALFSVSVIFNDSPLLILSITVTARVAIRNLREIFIAFYL